MQSYKLKIKFYSPLILYDRITLDSLVAYALAIRRNTSGGLFCIPQQLQQRDDNVKHELHNLITHHTPLYPLTMASYLQPIGNKCEYLDSWKKQFDSKYSHLADFGKAKRRINTSSGKYRSYNMPLPAVVMQSGFFAFIGDGTGVLDLLEEYIVSIGKKRAEGFGWIDSMELIDEEYSCYDIARMRPVPIEIAKKHKITGILRNCAWQSPYWLRKNICECVVPEK